MALATSTLRELTGPVGQQQRAGVPVVEQWSGTSVLGQTGVLFYGSDPPALPLPEWQTPVSTTVVAGWRHPGRVTLSPKKQREALMIQMDFAAYVDPNDPIIQVGSFQYTVGGYDYGETSLTIESPQINGSVVSYTVSGGVIGNTYVLSYFVLLASQRIVQLLGYLTVVPDTPGEVDVWPPAPPTGGGGGPPPANVPTLTLSASPISVVIGSASTLTWTSTNATAVVASGGWSGSQSLNGSATLTGLTATATYTLTASGAGGSTSASVTITVHPVLFSSQITVTSSQDQNSGAWGYMSGLSVGICTPTSLPAGGSALGLTIYNFWSDSTSVAGPIRALVLETAFDARITQTNQFDSIQIAGRTFTSAAATIQTNNTGYYRWIWYGTPVMTQGAAYVFTFVKAS